MELYKGKYFVVIFTEWCQEFPGQCIVSGKMEQLSDMTSDEWIELGLIEKELERCMKKVFDATMFNFACLMNNAYKDGEKPHVHYHFIPRYKGERIILNKKYVDKHFGFNMWKWSNSKIKRQKDIFNQDDRNKMFEMVRVEFKL